MNHKVQWTVKKQLVNWKKIFATHVTDWGFILEIYVCKKNVWQKKGEGTLKRQFTGVDIQMPIKSCEDVWPQR